MANNKGIAVLSTVVVFAHIAKKWSRGLCVSTPDSPTRMALGITLTPLAEGQGVILTAHPPGPHNDHLKLLKLTATSNSDFFSPGTTKSHSFDTQQP